MTREEAIGALVAARLVFDFSGIDAAEYTEAMNLAISALTPPSNEPLTLEEAKSEKFVWFEPLKEWAKVTHLGVLFIGSVELMDWETLRIDWGQLFKAYRRPPEGEEDA